MLELSVIERVCLNCGVKYGLEKSIPRFATFIRSTCQICKKVDEVTTPDFFKGLDFNMKNVILERYCKDDI